VKTSTALTEGLEIAALNIRHYPVFLELAPFLILPADLMG
jgi:hypothetical protein